MLNTKRPAVPTAIPMSCPVVVLAALLLSGALTFSNLASDPLNDWDEAWHARIAWDIAQNNTFLTYTDAGKIHYSLASAKPPLYFWMLALAMKLAGPTEFVIRVMPALCHVAMVGVVTAFCWYRLNWTVALATALLLSTNPVLVYHHGARSGEIDPPLVLFLTLTMIGVFRLSTGRRAWWLPVSWAAALLTKGAAALQIVPAAVLFLVWQRAWSALGRATLGFVVGAFPLVGFTLVREHWSPGFIALLVEEVRTRLTTSMGGGDYQPLRYVLLTARVFFPVLAGLVMVCFSVRGRFRLAWQVAESEDAIALLRWLLLWWLVPTALFSWAATQKDWYVAPALVPACILAAWLLRGGLAQLEHRGGRHIGPAVAVVIIGGMLGPAVWGSFVTTASDLERRAELDGLVAVLRRTDLPRPVLDYRLLPAERFYLARAGLPVVRVSSPDALHSALRARPHATVVYRAIDAPRFEASMSRHRLREVLRLPRRGTIVAVVDARHDDGDAPLAGQTAGSQSRPAVLRP